MQSPHPTLQDPPPATSRALIAAVIVTGILLLIGIGILVSLILGRMNEAPGLERAEGERLPVKAPPVVPASKAGPSKGSPRVSDAGQASESGPHSKTSGSDAGFDSLPAEEEPTSFTFDFGTPQPEGELAKVLDALTDRVRGCAKLAGDYHPKTLSVHLVRSKRSRVRVSAIEPEPPPLVGTCLSRLIHQETSSSPASSGHVVQVYELE